MGNRKGVAVLAACSLGAGFVAGVLLEARRWYGIAEEGLSTIRLGNDSLDRASDDIDTIANNNYYLQGMVEALQARERQQQALWNARPTETGTVKHFTDFVPYSTLLDRYGTAVDRFIESDDSEIRDNIRDELFDVFLTACRSEVVGLPVERGIAWPNSGMTHEEERRHHAKWRAANNI